MNLRFLCVRALLLVALGACKTDIPGSSDASLADLGAPDDLMSVDLARPADLAAPRDLSPPPDLMPAATCADKIRNQDETDVDCGGMTCPACGLDQACGGPTDCASRNCDGGKCRTGQIGALKVTRDGWSVFDGPDSKSKTWLTTPGPMGAGITVGGVDTISGAALAGFKAFILIFDAESPSGVRPAIADAEALALKDFVLKGGGLAIFLGHSSIYPASLRAAFDVQIEVFCEGRGTMDFTTDLPAAIRSGPWGTLPASLSWDRNCHENITLDMGSKALMIARSGARGEAAYIPPGALGAGSGPVFFFSDWYWSYSDYVDGDAWGVFFKNTVTYVMSR